MVATTQWWPLNPFLSEQVPDVDTGPEHGWLLDYAGWLPNNQKIVGVGGCALRASSSDTSSTTGSAGAGVGFIFVQRSLQVFISALAVAPSR